MQAAYSLYLLLISVLTLLLTMLAGGRVEGSVEFFQLMVLIPALYFILKIDFLAKVPNKITSRFIKCFIFLFTISLIQIIPLPENLLNIISPLSAKAYQDVKAEFSFLSLSPIASLNSIFWMFTLGLVGYLLVSAPEFNSKKSSWIHTSCYLTQDHISAILEYTIIFSGLISAIIALIHYVFQLENFLGLSNFDDIFGVSSRAHFPFTNPNHLAFMIELSLPFVLLRFLASCIDYNLQNISAFVKRKRRTTLVFWFLNIIILSVALFATMSKAGITLCILGSVFFIWQVNRKYKLSLYAEKVLATENYYHKIILIFSMTTLLIILIAVLVLIVLGDSGQDILNRRFEKVLVEGVDQGRIMFWQISGEALAKSPILGFGLACWHLAVAPYKTKEIALWKLDYAHSDFLQLAVEMGIIGLAVVLLAIGSVLYCCLKEIKKNKFTEIEYLRKITYLLSMIMPLIHASFDFPFHVPVLLLNYSLLLVLILRSHFD